MGYDLTYISLGGGRQSTALAICSGLRLHGVPKAEVAIFADTGDEVEDTYKHLGKFGPWLEAHGIKFEIVSAGHLGEAMLSGNRSFIPAFVPSNPPAPLRRKCTQEFKAAPLERRVRELIGWKPRTKKKVAALVGISLDESQRMKPSMVRWIDRLYPLIDARLRIEDCEKLCKEILGYSPVKSACRFCPYHDNRYWLWLKNSRETEFKSAVGMDLAIRDLSRAGVKNPAFLHRSCQPLGEIDFNELVNQPNQGKLWDSFTEECEGMCGV